MRFLNNQQHQDRTWQDDKCYVFEGIWQIKPFDQPATSQQFCIFQMADDFDDATGENKLSNIGNEDEELINFTTHLRTSVRLVSIIS